MNEEKCREACSGMAALATFGWAQDKHSEYLALIAGKGSNQGLLFYVAKEGQGTFLSD